MISFRKRICLISYSSGSKCWTVSMVRLSMLVQTVNCDLVVLACAISCGVLVPIRTLVTSPEVSSGSRPYDCHSSSCSRLRSTKSRANLTRCSLMNLARALENLRPLGESYASNTSMSHTTIYPERQNRTGASPPILPVRLSMLSPWRVKKIWRSSRLKFMR